MDKENSSSDKLVRGKGNGAHRTSNGLAQDWQLTSKD